MKTPHLFPCVLVAGALILGGCSSEQQSNNSPTPSATKTNSSPSSTSATKESKAPRPSPSAPSLTQPSPSPQILPSNAPQADSADDVAPPNQGYQSSYPSGVPPKKDPSQIPFANGGTCPAYKCGYGTNAKGNPNPSSGELQTLDGCNAGYITDQSLCNAVRNKANQYGW